MRRGVEIDEKNKKLQLSEDQVYKTNILDDLYKKRKKIDVNKIKYFAINLCTQHEQEKSNGKNDDIHLNQIKGINIKNLKLELKRIKNLSNSEKEKKDNNSAIFSRIFCRKI